MPARPLYRAALGAALLGVSFGAAAHGAVDWRTAVLDGADVRSLAIAPRDPDLVFAGTSSGQIFRSDDGGDSWRSAGGRIAFPGWIVSELKFDPNQPNRLWAAMWGLWGGGLVARTDDLGASWDLAADGLPAEQVYTVALVPGAPGHLYAGTRKGVFGSHDTGASWTHLTSARPEMQKVTSLLVDAAEPSVVLAGTWRRAYRSEDSGLTWGEAFNGMVLDSEVFTLNAVPGRPGEIWASTCGWVYHGLGLGAQWTRHTEGLAERRTPSFHVLPDGRLLAGTVAGAYRSVDGGLHWTRQTSPELAVLAIAEHPERPGRIFLGTEGSGVWRSTDGATTFERTSAGLTNVRISALVTVGDEVLAAVRYAGPDSGLYRSVDGGHRFSKIEAPEELILDLATAGGAVYAGTEGGLYQWRGSGWSLVSEVGSERVEEVSNDLGEVLARTPRRLYQLRGDRFEPVRYSSGAPRSGAFFENSVWLTDGSALHQVVGGEERTTTLPYPGGRLSALADRLVVAGRGGVWSRRWVDGPWETMVTSASRVVEVDDARFPLIVVPAAAEARQGASVQVYDATDSVLRRIDLPVPASSVETATIIADRLLLGTSGYGVLSGPLPGAAAEQVGR